MVRYKLRVVKKDQDILKAILLYGIPGIILLIVFQILPIITAFEYSFFKINLMNGTKQFLGLKNYVDAFSDKEFLHSLFVTFKYFLMRVPLQIIIGFLLALLISKPHRWTGLMRTIILIPVITSMVVITSIFGLMFHPSNGLVNSFLAFFEIPAQGFFTSSSQALPTVAFLTIWKNSGLTMLFFLAGLMAISDSLYEAADIDGANAWQKMIGITVPMLKPTFAFVFLTTTIHSFQVFGPVLLTTGGGPSGATDVVVMNIYTNAFTYNQVGYASTESVILAVILILISLVQNKIKKRNQEE